MVFVLWSHKFDLPNASLAPRAALVLAIGLAQASCFYLTGINERPRPRIQEKTSGPYVVGSELVFSATGSSDDQSLGGLVVEWQAAACDASGLSCQSMGSKETVPNTASDFTISPTSKGAIRIELTLRDEHGAFEKTTVLLPVVNQQPDLELQISASFPDPGDLGGFVLGLPVHLAAQATDADGDALTLTWTYEAPAGAGSVPENVTFEPVGGDEMRRELIGDVAGVWEVTLRADDGDGGVSESTKQVVFAPDGPPCIGALSPNASAGDVVFVSGASKTFSVLTALDALDPWPALVNAHPQVGKTTFRWSVANAAAPTTFTALGQNLSEVVVSPLDHSPGDQLLLRVELADRLALPVSCPVAEATCSAAQNACSQRMTWEIAFR